MDTRLLINMIAQLHRQAHRQDRRLAKTLFRWVTAVYAGMVLQSVRADVYHVAPKGDDEHGSGSNDRPWRTIQKAVDELSPGDAVLVHAGVYKERVEINVSGTAQEWVTLMGEKGTVISGAGLGSGSIVFIEDQSHIRLLNLELTGNSSREESAGIMVQGGGSRIEVRNCKIHGCKGKNAMGIGFYGSNPKVPLSEIVVEGCEIYDCEPAPSEALVINGNVEKFVITGNHIHDVNNIGIDFIGGEKDIVKDASKVARSGVCRKNRVERARSSYGGGYAAGIYVDGGKEIIIEDNVVTECDLGIEIGAENSGSVATGIIVKGNWLYKNDKAGLAFGGCDVKAGSVSGCQFIENILYHNTNHPRETQGELWIQFASKNTFSRNIVWAGAGGTVVAVEKAGASNQLDGNTYFSDDGESGFKFLWAGNDDHKGFARYQQVSRQDKESKFARPLFKNPDKGDFSQK